MKGVISAAIALAAASFSCAADETPAQTPDGGGVIAVTAIEAVAKVLKTDPILRTVTIEDPGGRTLTLDAAPAVALERIKKGALIDVRYVKAEALTIGRPAVPSGEQVRRVTMAPQSGAPAALTAKPKRAAGLISGIDRDARELTIVGSDEKPVALGVAPQVEGFDGLEIGDEAVIEYTEAVALSAVRHDGRPPRSP